MLLNIRDAAELLQTDERQLYRWVDDEEIPFQRVREEIRFNRSELLEWATSRRMSVALRAFDSEDPDDTATSLADALRIGGVHRAIPATDRESAIRNALAEMPLPPSVDRELLRELMLVRERASSTAISDGIAIPHVRHPVVAAGAPSSVFVASFERPIPFAASDGIPVRTMLVIVSPTVRAHLQMLARLARALRDPGFRREIDAGTDGDALCREAARVEADLGSTWNGDDPGRGLW
jgi:PTS system nitrogen regulatory IIA component